MNLGVPMTVGVMVFALAACTPAAAKKPPAVAITAEVSPNQEGEAVYKKHCQACHTIGGGKAIGPDLVNVADRRDAAWLIRWMEDPITMAMEDPIGQAMIEEYNGMPMPNPNLTDAEIGNVLAYIAARSAELPKETP